LYLIKRTIADDQVDTLVAMLVELLETVGGDGIDFDSRTASAASCSGPRTKRLSRR